MVKYLSGLQVWPEEDFPLQPVGTMTLNKNIDNFHNESEQIAFSPAVTIGGDHWVPLRAGHDCWIFTMLRLMQVLLPQSLKWSHIVFACLIVIVVEAAHYSTHRNTLEAYFSVLTALKLLNSPNIVFMILCTPLKICVCF